MFSQIMHKLGTCTNFVQNEVDEKIFWTEIKIPHFKIKKILSKIRTFVKLQNAAIDDHNFFFKKPGIFSGQKSSYSADLLKMI